MPKFKVIKEGVNEAIVAKVLLKVEGYLKELFHDDEIIKIDNQFSFTFGTVSVNIRVIGWHTEDALVEVFSYLADNIEISNELKDELLRNNATTHFGSFGLTFDKSVIYSYSLAGANLDLNEFTAAVQTVAVVADNYDEVVLANRVGAVAK